MDYMPQDECAKKLGIFLPPLALLYGIPYALFARSEESRRWGRICILYSLIGCVLWGAFLALLWRAMGLL